MPRRRPACEWCGGAGWRGVFGKLARRLGVKIDQGCLLCGGTGKAPK